MLTYQGKNDPMSNTIENISIEMKYKANHDIVKRSVTGSYIYLVIWVSIIIPHKFFDKNPHVCLWMTAILLFFAVVRIVLIASFNRIYKKNAMLWKILFYPVVWMPSLVWGVFCAWTFINPEFAYLSLAFIVGTAGLTGGGVSALVPSRILSLGLLTSYLTPGGIVLLLSDDYNISVSLIFLVYWIGLYAVTKNQHREYWQGLKSTFLLKEHTLYLEKQNTIDGLTGLKNRVFFDKCLIQELKRAIRLQSNLSLLFIDIDHFKKVNDEQGHLAGDDCLRQISDLMKTLIRRESDTIARYGGEEFAVILPDNNKEQATIIAEKIRSEIEAMSLPISKTSIALTVSIGISSMVPRLGMSEKEFIEIADKNLYKAKHKGRNQIVC